MPAAKRQNNKQTTEYAAMLERLALSGLDESDAELLCIEPVDAMWCTGAKLPAAHAGFKLPYFAPSGAQVAFYRVRYTEDTRTSWSKLAGKKPLRYAQPPGTVNGVYMPPFVDWAALVENVDVPLLITEGELKAAATTKLGLPTLGLGGVWCFQSSRKGQPLLAELEAIFWEGRSVFIIYDSDAASNPDVLKAESRLAERLLDKGAQVYICRIPPGPDGAKVGLDDWFIANNFDVNYFSSQILDTAYEYSGSSVLHDLNKKCTYVWDPGFIYNHERNQRHTAGAFKEHAFSNVHIFEKHTNAKGKEALIKVPAAKAWLEWPHRAECRGLIFAPGQDRITAENYLNTWQGWGVPEPVRGEIKPWHMLMEHLFGADVKSRKWFEQWLAYPLQNPGAKLAQAVLIWGVTHGSGKTLVGHTMMRLYGDKHSAEVHDKDLESAFNEWAVDKQFILLDDIVAKGDRALMRHLMTLVTQKTVRLNEKYVPSYAVPDCCNYYYTSNSPDAFYMDDDDRRFWIHEVLAGKFLDKDIYREWYLTDAAIAALWYYLLHVNLAGFDPTAPAPSTSGKREMTELGKSDLGSWVYDLKENTDVILGAKNMLGDLFTAAELHYLFDPAGLKKTTVNALARELKHAGFRSPSSKIRTPDGRMVQVYCIRNWHHWYKATWKQACDHYATTHPLLLNKAKKEKY